MLDSKSLRLGEESLCLEAPLPPLAPSPQRGEGNPNLSFYIAVLNPQALRASSLTKGVFFCSLYLPLHVYTKKIPL